MKKFPWIPVTDRAYRSRKKFCGVGVNDATYMTQPTVEGKVLRCPFHRLWGNMLSRCYDTKVHVRQPYYKGVTVHPDWFYFMDFRDWAVNKDWGGMCLDKDLLSPEKKQYGPDTCAFIRSETNTLIREKTSGKGSTGVDKNMGRYRAIFGGRLLGRYDTEAQAASMWRAAKAQALVEASFKEKDPRVPPALLKLASELLSSD